MSVAFLWLSLLAADSLSAEKIVEQTLKRNTLGLEQSASRLTMTLISKRGDKRERSFSMISMRNNGLRKTLLRFLEPATVRGTGFLALEHDQGEDDQYLYLPALGKTKRITGGQRGQRFMGSDLTYADLESRNLRRSKLKRLPDQSLDGVVCFVVEATPQDPSRSTYARTVSWVHPDSFVTLKVAFFDKSNEPLKTLEVQRLEKIQDRWVATQTRVDHHQNRTASIFEVTAVSFEQKLTPALFTVRALEQP